MERLAKITLPLNFN